MGLVVRAEYMAAQHGRFAGGAASVQFPFELLANQIFVPVTVNGKGPYTFILDTGAPGVVIASESANALGVTNDDMTFGFAKNFAATAAVGTFPLALSQPLVARTIHGIIGLDILHRYVWRVDYAKRMITVYDPDRFVYTGSGAVLPFAGMYGAYDPQVDGQLVVRGRDPIPVRFTLDLGAGGTVISAPLVAQYDLLQSVGRTLPEFGVVGTTPDVGLEARVAALRIGPYTLEQPIVLLTQDKDGPFASKSIGVNLGGSILRRFTVTIDYSRQRLIFEPNRSFGQPFQADATGIAFMAAGSDFKTFTIRDVAPNSPGTEIGLQKGDVITALDGRPAANYAAWQLQDVFKESGRRIALTIRRGNAIFVKTIALRRLL